MLSNIVLKVSHSVLSSMKTHYADDLTAKLPTGAVFCAKRNGCTITAYKSGKVLFQGNSAEQESKKWEQDSLPSEKIIHEQKFCLAFRFFIAFRYRQ